MFLDEQDEIPWDALRYVCGQINYGGRVTDDWDRRCLMSILGGFFCTDILGDDYKFSPSGNYFAPKEGNLSSYHKYIETLPIEADPEIFGMHENANITFQRQETNIVVATILSIQPREIGGAGGMTTDEIVAKMAVEMAETLPGTMKIPKLKPEGDDSEDVQVDSLVIVLRQELERFNRLLVCIANSLQQIQKAIKGEVVMSQELDLMYTSMINNQVPDLWAKVAYPSLKPLATWMIDLHARVEALAAWNNTGVPTSFWLPGFFFPQGFMTGVLQNHSRKYKIPIDTLRFMFEVKDIFKPEHVLAAPNDGVLISGLYMDGARWDPRTRSVADSNLGELFCNVPIIHFIPSTETKAKGQNYECPLYKTSVRAGILSTTGQSTNFVLAVDLPSTQSVAYWVLKGAALLCQLDT